jgi:uncharacterized membrane protein
MDAILLEWGSLLLRWLHVIAGIAWIGASFYFMHLDASLKPSPDIPAGKGGETWEVHGGGFYQVRKYLVAPARLPDELIWHKWQSYATWASGFALLVWVYYLTPELYLIDPEVAALTPLQGTMIGIAALAIGWLVYDGLCRSPLGRHDMALACIGLVFIMGLAFGFSQVFSGRAALIHTGAVMATWMSGNVFLVIIPNQKKVIASLMAGEAPDPALGKAAKLRSTHNNYLTLPVLFLMLSNHYPLTYSTPWSWSIVGLVVVAGALIRVFYNHRHAGRRHPWWTLLVASGCIGAAALISIAGSPAGRETLGLGPLPARGAAAASVPEGFNPAHLAEATAIVQSRCAMCHAREPLWPGIAMPPKGVVFETAGDVARQARAIRLQSILSHAMPPNNLTAMTAEERTALARLLKRE